MNLDTKLVVLNQIYKIYDEFAATLDVACKQYCAQCCTRNVTLTTLEGYKIAHYLISNGKSDLFEKLKDASHKKRFQPLTTTNQLAEICMRGDEPPEEENDPSWGRCPFLTDNECPVYPVRPFGCRCFVSKQNCSETGYADTEPFVIAVNNVFLQFIEHIDAQGFSGNLTDVLLFMASDNNRQCYKDSTLTNPCDGLISNAPIKVVLVSPEHKDKAEPILRSLQSIKVPREQI
ncbi:YkgJ family cysteine cluster protein [Desulfonema magnum]|uniref:Zinc- or iron-chelating domain-containing protein n=1 Tax=Desulfonema magnum TaxID=45655 RepID=A0A975BW96_9BACT|nr:YkgJ family cysteine cluster protein [Desulfonema magnum]QTA92448.1 Putative zinc- or iron-chelating domain-containing protein [Desulfonema magnum]